MTTKIGPVTVNGHARVVIGALAMLALILAAAIAGQALAAKDDLELASRAAGASGSKGNGESTGAAISADGRVVAFESNASNIHADDADTVQDIYVRDLQSATTTLVSRATGASGAKGDRTSSFPAISSDGRFVAFNSTSTNLHPDDSDTTYDVFVRDLQNNTTTLVSRATGGSGVKGDGNSFDVSISADGSRVAFESQASNLDPDDPDNGFDVFVRDLQANTTTLLSRATGASGTKGTASGNPDISGNGHFVAFDTGASLDAADADAQQDVYVRDLTAQTTTFASRATGGSGVNGNGEALFPSISSDGSRVAFRSTATNLHPDDLDVTNDVFVRDLPADTTTLVSRAAGTSGAKGNAASISADVSSDGRYVAFRSVAANLDPSDGDAVGDIFVRDLQNATTTLVSRSQGPSGLKGDDSSDEPSISGTGRVVAFESAAANLHPDDTDPTRDVFVRHVLADVAPPAGPGQPSPGAGADPPPGAPPGVGLAPPLQLPGRSVPPSRLFSMSLSKGKDGGLVARLVARSPGRFSGTARFTAPGARGEQPFDRDVSGAQGPGAAVLAFKAGSKARRALVAGKRLRVTVAITFTPTGAKGATKSKAVILQFPRGKAPKPARIPPFIEVSGSTTVTTSRIVLPAGTSAILYSGVVTYTSATELFTGDEVPASLERLAEQACLALFNTATNQSGPHSAATMFGTASRTVPKGWLYLLYVYARTNITGNGRWERLGVPASTVGEEIIVRAGMHDATENSTTAATVKVKYKGSAVIAYCAPATRRTAYTGPVPRG